jgi:Protein of unknown function (DUF3662)/FHA domain
MNLLKSVETTIANLVEGAFGRMFRSEVRPLELARKLAREMDAHRTMSLSRVYAPNEYSVWLSPQDRARYEGLEHEVIDELCAYLLEHARREDLILPSQPVITFHTDERLALGEFGIKAQLVPVGHGEESVHPQAPPRAPDERGQTMIYSTAARLRGRVAAAEPQAPPQLVARLVVDGRDRAVPPDGATIGRSRECDMVFDDAGISRLHAELRPSAAGWTIEDRGSTNGVHVNGERVHGARLLHAGDRVELGSTEVVFDLR